LDRYMGLLELLGFNKLPAGVAGSTLVLADATTLARAGALLAALQARFGNVAVAQRGAGNYRGSLPQIELSADNVAERLKKIRPQRLIVLGLDDSHAKLEQAAGCPAWWINAQDVATTQACIAQLPTLVNDPTLCARLKEQRDGGRWVGYFAATGEDEEDIAYALFSRMMRHRMGLMILAPRDRERCEPVYRESIKYRLQTIRHARLSTSFVPIKTRVYYVEDSQPLEGLYACVDFVVAGGTLHAHARNAPDIVSPMLHGKPVIVGGAHRDDPVVAAALAAGVVLAGDDNEQIFAHAQRLIDDPAYGAQLTSQASAWLHAQVGALGRVMALIE
jgi:3-deoxy-D-manno-octulosonic-acid transferase